MLGCYSGSVSNTEVKNADSFTLPADCVLEDGTTSAPVTSPVLSPTTSSCSDSPLMFKRGKHKRTCDWVGSKPDKIEKRCSKKGVGTHCPVTCNVTCTDSMKRFYIESKDKWVKCKWVARKNTSFRCQMNGVSETCTDTC